MYFVTLLFIGLLGNPGYTDATGSLVGYCEMAYVNPGRNWSCESCKVGCHGRLCDQRCRHCDVDGCEKDTGRCHRCKPGYYGEECGTRCPKGCTKNEEGIAECERSTGYCSLSCRKGLHGDLCDKQCPRHCRHLSCSRYSSICLRGCNKGWSGLHCDYSCKNCLHGVCKRNGICKHGCKDGYYGNMCERKCVNCDGDRCDRKTGVCFQCRAGFFGPRCDLQCSQNCAPLPDASKPCDRYSGRCLNDCIHGTYGYHCSHKCNKNCKFSKCSVHDGFCNQGCREGWTGFQCESPRNCLGELHDGDRCTRGCIMGMTGKSCDVVCPLNCKTCDQHTGLCTSCHEGHYGDACVQECSFRCKKLTCNMDGSCNAGCEDGFHGDRCGRLCDLSCNSCDRHNYKCLDCVAGYDLLPTGQCVMKYTIQQESEPIALKVTSSGHTHIPDGLLGLCGVVLTSRIHL